MSFKVVASVALLIGLGSNLLFAYDQFIPALVMLLCSFALIGLGFIWSN